MHLEIVKLMSLEKAVKQAIEEYNRYRSPEAKASLVEMGNRKLTIDFEGSFCRSCGVSDYFEDFIYELKRHAEVEMTIQGSEQIKPEKFRVKFAFSITSIKPR